MNNTNKNIKRLDSVGYTMDIEKMVVYPTMDETGIDSERRSIPIDDISDEWINQLSDDDFEVAAEYVEIPFRCLRC